MRQAMLFADASPELLAARSQMAFAGGDREWTAIWRRRARTTGVPAGMLALAGLPVAHSAMPELWQAFSTRGWPMVAVSILAEIATIGLVGRRRETPAALTACGAVGAVMAGWGVARYSFLIAPNFTIHETAAPANVPWLLLMCIAAGLVFLSPPLIWLTANLQGSTLTVQ